MTNLELQKTNEIIKNLENIKNLLFDISNQLYKISMTFPDPHGYKL